MTSLPSDTLTSGPQEKITLGTPTVVPGHTGTCTSPSPPAYFALLTQLVILTGKSRELEGWKRASVPRFSSAPTAGCSPASLKGHFSQLLPTLRRQQIGSSAPSAPNSRCKVHFNLADPLTASAASSELHSGASKSPHAISVSQVNRATCLGQPSGSPAQHTVFALHIIFGKPGSLSAFLIQIISDVPPSPGQRFRDANIISSTVCSLSNYQPAAAFPAGAPGGIKRCYLQLLPTRTSHVLMGWRRLPKQAG